MPEPDVPTLEFRCRDLLDAIANIGDLRAGSLKCRYRKCGKRNCRCAREGDPGHGPVWTLVFRARGKTRNRVIPREADEELSPNRKKLGLKRDDIAKEG